MRIGLTNWIKKDDLESAYMTGIDFSYHCKKDLLQVMLVVVLNVMR